MQGGKSLKKKNEQSNYELWGNFRWPNTWVTEVPKQKREKICFKMV